MQHDHNECREKLEKLIDNICDNFSYYTPRMYRENARKDCALDSDFEVMCPGLAIMGLLRRD